MKRVLLSVAISLALVIGYLIAGAVIVALASPDLNHLSASAVYKVDLPMRLPKLIYYYFDPPIAQDYSTQLTSFGVRKILLAIGFFVFNVLLYAIPVYLVLTLIARRRRQPAPTDLPPPPPDLASP